MTYHVGIDLGTTYTAAAVHRDDRASIFSLGGRAASIPSVVLLRQDETVLTGEAAERRAITEPERVAREFKRRLGDTTPIIVGGSPYSAEALMARLLTAVLGEVEAREGGPPDRIAISHPANWGPYKNDLLRQAIRLAGLDPESIVLLTEPEAAAISYATQERVESGEIVAVYDLGGGTFDAAVLRRTADGFEIIGKPEGIERLGGIDFDAAVFAHVARALDGKLDELDPEDPAAMAGVARLRQDCVDAKEALSSDTDATIPVLVPGVQTDVRITRREFESLIRPSLVDSIEAMRRAFASAGVQPDEISKVLLVGGSSRVPLIAQLVSSELGRPIAVDAHPKHAVALGAAHAAAGAMGRSAAAAVPEPTSMPDAPPPAEPASEVPAPPVAAAAGAVPVVTEAVPSEPPAPVEPASAPIVPEPTPPAPTPQEPAPAPVNEPAPVAAAPDSLAPDTEELAAVDKPPEAPGSGPGSPAPPSGGGGPNRAPLIAALVALLAVVAVAGFVLANSGGDGGDGTTTTEVAASTTDASDATTSTTTPATSETTEAPTEEEIALALSRAIAPFEGAESSFLAGTATLTGTVFDDAARNDAETAAEDVDGVSAVVNQLEVQAPDEQCTEEIMSEERWGCIESVTFDGSLITATYTFEDAGVPFNTGGGFHFHFFGSDIDPITAGLAGDASIGGGAWRVWDDPDQYQEPATTTFGGGELPEKLCVRIATSSHTLTSLSSGNCWPIETVG